MERTHLIFREESEMLHDSLRPVQERWEQPLHLKFGNFQQQWTSRQDWSRTEGYQKQTEEPSREATPSTTSAPERPRPPASAVPWGECRALFSSEIEVSAPSSPQEPDCSLAESPSPTPPCRHHLLLINHFTREFSLRKEERGF